MITATKKSFIYILFIILLIVSGVLVFNIGNSYKDYSPASVIDSAREILEKYTATESVSGISEAEKISIKREINTSINDVKSSISEVTVDIENNRSSSSYMRRQSQSILETQNKINANERSLSTKQSSINSINTAYSKRINACRKQKASARNKCISKAEAIKNKALRALNTDVLSAQNATLQRELEMKRDFINRAILIEVQTDIQEKELLKLGEILQKLIAKRYSLFGNDGEEKGCRDLGANNFDPAATIADSSSCDYGNNNNNNNNSDAPIITARGCTDTEAINYDTAATEDDGSCQYEGCTNPIAENFDPKATLDDGSCILPVCNNPEKIYYDFNNMTVTRFEYSTGQCFILYCVVSENPEEKPICPEGQKPVASQSSGVSFPENLGENPGATFDPSNAINCPTGTTPAKSLLRPETTKLESSAEEIQEDRKLWGIVYNCVEV